MKKKFENNYVYWGLTVFSVLAAAILLFFVIYRFADIVGLCKKFIGILSPILWGLLLAYILSPIIRFLDEKLFHKLAVKIFGKDEGKVLKYSRIFSLITASFVLLLVVFAFFYFVLPAVIRSIDGIIQSTPEYFNSAKEWLANMFGDNENLRNVVLENFDKVKASVLLWVNESVSPGMNNFIITLSTGIMGFFKTIVNILLGFIVSIYVLMGKEKFGAQAKKILYAFVSPERAKIILDNVKYTDRIFGGFLYGKVIDSLIIGILCFLFMFLFQMPYAVLISVIVGITNIIPYFGPFIGAIPSALLILLVSPGKCITFVIFIFLLQQFDGNILGPKILGDKIGLRSFWVLFAILIFGGLFGFVGMLFGVPIFAILYSFINGVCKRRLEKSNLPTNTKDYEQMKYIDPKTGKPVL